MSMLDYRYGHMVHEAYVERVREIMARRRERIAALKTKADALTYVRRARAAVRKAFGPLPTRTPLRAEVTGKDAYPGYILEKVVYHSRPEFLVTGNLYVPKSLAGKAPAVLGLCGHAIEGKAWDTYQSFAQGLARKGFVVFMVDPIQQGERRQFYPKDGTPSPQLCHAHNLMGNQMALVGDFFGTWLAWDAIRGLDYLLSRPEVDRSRVGVTGNSGGGTQTTYVTALDPRVTMASPNCYICSYLANLENEEPADAEQDPPGILASGLDHADLLLTYAPRPTIIIATDDDFFDIRAARAAYEDVRKVHRLLGSNGSAAFFAGKGPHSYSKECREAMYGFFMKHAGVRAPIRETGVKLVEKEKLYALPPKGETHPFGSRRAFEFTADTAAKLERRRGTPGAKKVISAARKVLSIPKAMPVPHHRMIRDRGGATGPLGLQRQFAVETAPGIQAIVTAHGKDIPLTYPPKGPAKLYIGNTSSLEDLELRDVRKLARGRTSFITVDPRGMGQSFPKTSGNVDFFLPYNADFMYAQYSDMLGEDYLGGRVLDVLRTMDFLLANGVTKIELAGRGLGSVIASFAALLHPSGPRVEILHYLPSYRLLADSPVHTWPRSVMPRGILKHFDLPDVYRVLGRRLRKSRPWGPMMKPLRTRTPRS